MGGLSAVCFQRWTSVSISNMNISKISVNLTISISYEGKWWLPLPGYAQMVVISDGMAKPLDILVKKPLGHHNLDKI